MIYIARHGQTDWNLIHKIQGQLDVPLNATGRKEAVVCAKGLASVNIDKIISSDLLRTKETANIINKILSVPVSFDIRLRELNCGTLQGKDITEMTQKIWHTFIYNPRELNSESLENFYNRLKSFFSEIDIKKNTLIVTHTGVIKMIKHLVDNPNSYNPKDFEENSLKFKVKNCDIFTYNKKQNLKLLQSDFLLKNLNSLTY